MITDYYSYKDVVVMSILEQDIPVLLLALLFLHQEYISYYEFVFQRTSIQANSSKRFDTLGNSGAKQE